MSRNEAFRISIAGAQEKTALLRHEEQWQRPSGTTPTTHILKLPIGTISHAGIDLSASVENEWLCLQILKQFGLPVAHTSIEHFEDQKVLVLERFDRRYVDDQSWILRLPCEDFCQVLGVSSALKYESDGGPGINIIMDRLSQANTPLQSRKQFIQTVFLFWLLSAIDGHAKNFSVFLHSQGRFELTPIYDVISAYPMAATRQLDYRKLHMAMALQNKNKHYAWHEIQARHWQAQAHQVNFPASEMQKIIEQSPECLDSVISGVSTQLPSGFPEPIATAMFEGMRKGRDKSAFG